MSAFCSLVTRSWRKAYRGVTVCCSSQNSFTKGLRYLQRLKAARLSQESIVSEDTLAHTCSGRLTHGGQKAQPELNLTRPGRGPGRALQGGPARATRLATTFNYVVRLGRQAFWRQASDFDLGRTLLANNTRTTAYSSGRKQQRQLLTLRARLRGVASARGPATAQNLKCNGLPSADLKPGEKPGLTAHPPKAQTRNPKP